MTPEPDNVAPSPSLPETLGRLVRPDRRSWRRWRLWISLAAGVALTVIVILGARAARYQPLEYGSVGNSAESFPGLPAGKGIHPVNNFGGFREDYYVPPQRGTFSLFADIRNNGPYGVTIVSVSVGNDGPMRLAAPVRYSTFGMGGSNEVPPPTSKVLHDVALGPGQEMFVGFPVKTWPCWQQHIWMSDPSFYVTERYLMFTRTVPIAWDLRGATLIMHEPGGYPGDPNTSCLPGITRADLPKPPPAGPQAVAGTIIRIYKGKDVGELRLTEMTGPDAASLNPPLPRCFRQHAADERIVNFDLNYSDINTIRGTAPGVHVTITGPGGTVLIAGVPRMPSGNNVCQPFQSFFLSSESSGSQEVLGLILRLPLHAALHDLQVQVDGHPITVPLSPVCARDGCFQDNPPVEWTAGTPYSLNLRI